MIFSYLLNMQSHPSWVCGLKLHSRGVDEIIYRSHPSWVCGLKHITDEENAKEICHTLRGCVD